MKKTIIIVLTVAMILITGMHNNVLAGWGNETTHITAFYIWGNGNAHFKVADMENPEGCGNPQYLTLDSNMEHFQALLVVLMNAYFTNQTVRLYYSGCTAEGYPLIATIAIPNAW